MTSWKGVTIASLFWKLFEQGGIAVATLLVQIVLARLLVPEQFGMMAIMLVFINIGNVVVQSGLNTAIIQSKDATEADYSTVFWMSLTASVVLYAVIFFATPFIADFYGMPSAVMPLRVLSLVLMVNAYNSVMEAIIARHMEFKKTFIAALVACVLSGIVGVAAALYGLGIWALVLQQLVQQCCKCVMLAVQVSWRPAFVFVSSRAVTLLSFGWKLLASGLLNQAYQGLSDLLIGKVFTKVDLGYVSQGKKYPMAVGILLDGAIQPVMLSATSRKQDDLDLVKRMMRRALKTSTFLIMPAMALFAAAAQPLVVLILGEQWLPAVPFLQMYCFVYALLPIHTTNLQVLNGLGRSDLFLKLEVIKTLVGVSILSFMTFVVGDIYAIMVGYMISGVIATFINAYPNKKVVGYSYAEQLRDICPAFLLSLVCAAAVFPVSLMGFGNVLTVAIQAVVMLLLYCILSKLLRLEAFDYLLNTVGAFLRNRH